MVKYHTGGRKMLKATDATKELRLLLKPKHVNKAKVANPNDCVLARCLKLDHEAKQVHILKNTAYVEDSQGNITRYVISAQTRLAICQFDVSGKWPIPGDGVHVVLRPPMGTRSLNKLRSPAFKAYRESIRGKHKRKLNKLRKATDGISAEAIRSGVGYYVK